MIFSWHLKKQINEKNGKPFSMPHAFLMGFRKKWGFHHWKIHPGNLKLTQGRNPQSHLNHPPTHDFSKWIKANMRWNSMKWISLQEHASILISTTFSFGSSTNIAPARKDPKNETSLDFQVKRSMAIADTNFGRLVKGSKINQCVGTVPCTFQLLYMLVFLAVNHLRGSTS